MPLTFDVSEDDFDRLVVARSHETPVLVDISADWCAPCRVLAPLLHQAAENYAGKFRLALVDADENMRIAGRHAVRGFPTVVAYSRGRTRRRKPARRPPQGPSRDSTKSRRAKAIFAAAAGPNATTARGEHRARTPTDPARIRPTDAQARRRKGRRKMAAIPTASGDKKARFLLDSLRRTREGRWFLHLQSEAACQSADRAAPTSTLPW